MSRSKVMQSVLPVLLITMLFMSVVPPAFAAPPLSKSKSTVYIVQMVQDPVVAYEGALPGLPATKPNRGQKINPRSQNVQRYLSYLDGQHNAALAAVGVNTKIYDYRYTFNGFAAKLRPDQVAALKARSDVAAIWVDELRHLQTDNTPTFLGLPTGLWAANPNIKGEDVIIGVIDTGIWPEHPSFSDQTDLADRPGNSGKRMRAYGPPPSGWSGTCQAGQLFSHDDCNYKLIGARYFKDGFTNFEIHFSGDYLSARDASGHGSHTAGTSGGNANVPASIFGINRGTISGIAPRARIAAYKACWADAGCALSDLVSAIDTAVADGVDVINYSIGSDTPELLGADDIAFLFAADAGVFVATSAGNAGPEPSTVGSPASDPWVTSVGANTHSRFFLTDLVISGPTDDDPPGPPQGVWGASVTLGISDYRLVDAEGIEDTEGDTSGKCLNPFAPGTFAPTDVVLCNQYDFGVARITRVANVAAGGGGAVIFHNSPTVNVMPTDNHPLPTVHVLNSVGQPLKDYLVAHPGEVTVTFATSQARYSPGHPLSPNDSRVKAPVMTSFSSRGPNGAAADIIKPDITAPGYSILAAGSPTPLLGAPNQLFQAIMGTSMSSPHIAGVGALLTQAHPDWTPAMVKSAIMTTAQQNVYQDYDSATPDANPFDMGAGHVAPNAAVNPGLVYDAGFNQYLGFLCGATTAIGQATCDGLNSAGISLDPSDLNLASIGVSELVATQTVSRTVTNASNTSSTYNVIAEEPAGVDVSVDPPQLTLDPGESATYAVTFTTEDDAAFDAWSFGAITWSDGQHSVRSPLAIRPTLLSAPAEVSGTGTSGSLTFDIAFGYQGEYSTGTHGLIPANTESATVVDDPSNDIETALANGIGINTHTIDVPPGALYLRISLFDEYTDGEDDLDLYVWGPGSDSSDLDELLDLSGSATSAEEVNVPAPASGTYTITVHGWQTDGPDANYTLFTWSLGEGDEGNMVVTAPAAATPGPASIDVSWGELANGVALAGSVKYLGAVSHNRGTERIGLTLVRIDTDTEDGTNAAGTPAQGDTQLLLPYISE